jgi:hypothetical protein
MNIVFTPKDFLYIFIVIFSILVIVLLYVILFYKFEKLKVELFEFKNVINCIYDEIIACFQDTK